MNRTTRLARAALWTAGLASAAVAAATPAEALPSMLTIPQAVTIAEVTQTGTAYGLKREVSGQDVVYHVRVSTADRGVVDVHVHAYGGRVDIQPRHRS